MQTWIKLKNTGNKLIYCMNWKLYYNAMCITNFFYCCQSRNSLCLVVALRWYIKYEQSVKLTMRHRVINRREAGWTSQMLKAFHNWNCFGMRLFVRKSTTCDRLFSFFFYLLCASSSLWCISSPRRYADLPSPRWTPSPTALCKQIQGTHILNSQYLTCIGCKKMLNDWKRWKGGQWVKKKCDVHK